MMKTIISIFSIAALITMTACGNNSKTEQSTEKKTDSTTQSTANNPEAKKGGSVDNVVTGYLDLKNALTKDNGNDAATAANKITTAIESVDEASLTPYQQKVFADVKDDIKEHAEHIGSNASNITQQREHFDLLSQDMIDLLKETGTTETLYRDFCPMYNNKKGASWLSETKEIKNPYYGKKMPKCGEMKEEIKPKG